MNKLSIEKQTQIIHLIVEGCSLRTTARFTDTSLTTVQKLLEDVGRACLKFHSETVVQIRCKRVECDEIWSFVYSKEKNTADNDKHNGLGDVWTWVAIDPDSKLIISWYCGHRDQASATFFMNDLWCRLRTRPQLTTDGYKAYIEAVADSFGGKVDFAQLVKQYSTESKNKDGRIDRRERYTGAKRVVISGAPDLKKISTSMVERQNLTMRMSMRRFTRKTNAFSKKFDNHCFAQAIHFVYYNFCRIHKTLRIAPAMAAGLTKRFMSIGDIANLVPIEVPKKRGPYKKRGADGLNNPPKFN